MDVITEEAGYFFFVHDSLYFLSILQSQKTVIGERTHALQQPRTCAPLEAVALQRTCLSTGTLADVNGGEERAGWA